MTSAGSANIPRGKNAAFEQPTSTDIFSSLGADEEEEEEEESLLFRVQALKMEERTAKGR